MLWHADIVGVVIYVVGVYSQIAKREVTLGKYSFVSILNYYLYFCSVQVFRFLNWKEASSR